MTYNNGWRVALFLISLMLITACSVQDSMDPKTVSEVDINKYAGTWYEIAAFPNYFQRGCTCTRATYRWHRRYLRVINTCYRHHRPDSAIGKAWPIKGSHNSKLSVTFFWPFYGDYWILYVDPDYHYAIVGTPERNRLWILARTPQISETEFDHLVTIAKNKGYPVGRLVKTVQDCYPGEDRKR